MNQDRELLKAQYEKFIYPKPVDDINKEVLNIGRVLYADPNFSWHFLWPEKPYCNKSKKLNVLVAGCGSDQAAILAQCNPRHNFIGIDISERSIAHQKKLKNKHKLDNLKLICDDFIRIKFNEKFDYIISTGVIHHLYEPEIALKFFNENLEDEGVINLMVYGNKKSHSLNQVKKIFKTLNLDHDNESIKTAKNLIFNLNSVHPAKLFSMKSLDMNYDSGIVDFLLHKQERFFNIVELIELLRKNNLVIKNFFDGKISSITKFFLNDIERINFIRNLEIEKKLELGQILNWDDRNIELVISKKKQIKHSMVYNKLDIKKLYLSPSRSIKYEFSNDKILIEERFSKNKYTYNFIVKDKPSWKKIFSGKMTVEDAFKNTSLSKDNRNLDLFEILIENFHIDFSYHPFENYINFYGK